MPERPGGSHQARQVLVAVAHGSADPRAAATITDLMAVAAERAAARGVHLPEVRTAYLGHAAPSLPQVMGAVGRASVTVLPLLLTAAYHSKTDIPRALARLSCEFPRLRVSYGATLGPHPLLLSALERRLAEADPLGHAGRPTGPPRADRGGAGRRGIHRPGGERHHHQPGGAMAGPGRVVRRTPGQRGRRHCWDAYPLRSRDRAAARRGPPGAGRHLPARPGLCSPTGSAPPPWPRARRR